jgi:hypothetical protein
MSEIKLPPFKLGCEPTRQINEPVWVIVNGQVHQTRIVGINFTEVAQGHGQGHVLITTGYETNVYSDFIAGNRSFRPWQIISNETEANRLAVWHAVVGLSEDQWLTVTEDVLSEEDMPANRELSSCFDEIEPAQKLFIRCKADGGLIERDVETLAAIIKRDGRPSVPGPNLKNVLGQLGLTWPTEKLPRED